VFSKGVLARLLSRAKQSISVPDYTGMPTHACPCGEKTFELLAVFEDYEIVLYSTTVKCHSCGAKLTAPTPLDRLDFDNIN